MNYQSLQEKKQENENHEREAYLHFNLSFAEELIGAVRLVL